MSQLDQQQRELLKRLEVIRQLKSNPTLALLNEKINSLVQENKSLNIRVSKLEELLYKKNQQNEKLNQKNQALEYQIKNQFLWENEDLDSKNSFESKYIYKVYSSSYNGGGILVTWNFINALQWSHGSTLHKIEASNKRKTNHGCPVQKILKKKMQA